MSGDPANASIWVDADVYVAFDLEAESPATIDDDFGVDWELVGLLDGDDGFSETRDEDVNDHYAWGGILIATSRRNFKLTKKLTPLEYNTTTRQLVYPGSATGEIIVPRPAVVKIAFETTSGEKVRRLISRYKAELSVDGDLTVNETDVESFPLVATIFPDGDGVLFDEQLSEALGS